MSRERRSIDSPMMLDFSSMLVAPLLFVLQESHEPAGIIESPSPGATFAHSPWHIELTLQMNPPGQVCIFYIIPKDDETNLFVACIGDTFESFFQLMSGDDYGDKVTKLVASEWPDVHSMLLHSEAGTPGQRILCNIVTSAGMQWALADQIPASQNEFYPQQEMDLLVAALSIVVRSMDPTALPGLVEGLGGPDLLSRRLDATAGMLSSIADVLGGLVEFSPSGIPKIFSGAKNFVSHSQSWRT